MIVKSIGLEFKPGNKLEKITYVPPDTKHVTGKVRFTRNGSAHHSILVASRFGTDHKEANGPFPGWFVQIVGGKLQIAWGNGRTWRSCTAGAVTVGKAHTLVFDLNNHTSTVRAWLDDQECVTTENEYFKYATSTIVVGALNLRPEFAFDGTIHELVLGQGFLPEPVSKPEAKLGTVTLESYEADLKTIGQHLGNVDMDLMALGHIDLSLAAWRDRGVDIPSESVHAQMKLISDKVGTFMQDTRGQVTTVQAKDSEISKNHKKIQVTDDTLADYRTSIVGLFEDIDLIDEAANTFEQIKSIGINVPDNVKTEMSKQRQAIVDTLLVISGDLKKRIELTRQIMEEIKE